MKLVTELPISILQFENSTMRQLQRVALRRLKNRSLALLGISPAGSDAGKTAQLAGKNFSLYTWGFQ
jgi:hypothetical protein